jgi:hypothetical protein
MMSNPAYLHPSFHGFELTFIPRRRGSRWQEWRDVTEAREKVQFFNMLLWDSEAVKQLAMVEKLPPQQIIWGKTDVFRTQLLDPGAQPHNSWCLEVNNYPMLGSGVSRPSSMEGKVLAAVYDIARGIDLHPHISVTKRDGTIIDYPNGGGHQHVQTDFWEEGSQFLLRMFCLENALCIDFANNPWLRWLFAHWNDNVNSSVAVNLTRLGEMEQGASVLDPKANARWEKNGRDNYVHDVALLCHSIKQRIACTGKPCRPTYEFRFLDMPRSVEELGVHTRFISSWVGYHVGRADGYLDLEDRPTFTLTSAQYQQLVKDAGYAKAQVEAFMGRIGLSGAETQKMIDMFWERGYLRRMKYGQAV